MIGPVKNGQTSVILRLKLLDSSSTTGAGLTGLTNASSGLIIATIADNESTTTSYTSGGSTIQTITTLGTYAAPSASNCRFKEVDNANHKGVYEFQFADARYGVANAKSLLVSVLGATNLAQADFVIPLWTVDPYSQGFNLLDASCNVVQWNGSNVASPATAGVPDVNVKNAGNTAWASGSLTSGVFAAGAINRAALSADSGLQTVRSNTAAAGAAGTITLDASASSTDNFYNGDLIYLTGGTGAGQARIITAYAHTTQVATITPNWAVNPDNTSTFAILSSGQTDTTAINLIPASSVTTVNANIGETQPLNFTGTGGSALVKCDAIDINSVAASSVTTINANIGMTQPVNFTGTGASALVKADMQDIAGSAVSTSTAQIGVNVVNFGGSAGTFSGGKPSVTLSSNISKNASSNGFMFVMTDSSTHAPKTGLTVTPQVAIDGGAFASTVNSVTEVANGTYTINLAAADTNGNHLMLRFTATGADDLNIEIITQP